MHVYRMGSLVVGFNYVHIGLVMIFRGTFAVGLSSAFIAVSWVFEGFHPTFLMGFNGIFMGFHGPFMALSWTFVECRRTFMGFSWAFHGLPWTFVAVSWGFHRIIRGFIDSRGSCTEFNGLSLYCCFNTPS